MAYTVSNTISISALISNLQSIVDDIDQRLIEQENYQANTAWMEAEIIKIEKVVRRACLRKGPSLTEDDNLML